MALEIQGPGFLVFFQYEVPEGGFKETDWFDFPDTPPKRKTRKRKKVEKIVERIAVKVSNRPKVDQELALRLALINEKIRYNKLYLELLEVEVQKQVVKRAQKRKKRTIILLLTGDG